MSKLILTTKLYIPSPRPNTVLRTRLIKRLNKDFQSKLTLISAPAGFGKTTLVIEWAAYCRQPVAWLSLDEGDNDPARFLTYLIAGLQTLELSKASSEPAWIAKNLGEGLLGALQSPQPPSTESILTALINEISAIPQDFTIVLDDYHVIDARPVDNALVFLIERMPPQMHLIIATREDPNLPLASLRARGQLTELRVGDLRFTPSEAAGFLNNTMGLTLSLEDIAALETRTEGWIAGLQLAALSMQGNKDTAGFIRSFTGSHHFVLDYLVEEVLSQQSENIQYFLLRTSILDRLCGPLCDAILPDSSACGQETLEYLEHANLFVIPLDNDRRWYRYHHLFADLLRQRLLQNTASADVSELHIRASRWYESNNLEIEAFQHAAAANDIERAERLIDGKGMPIHFRGAVTAILDWLASLPNEVLDTRPMLWVRYGTMLLVTGQTSGVEEKLQAAEAALHGTEPDEKTRNLAGQIATARATLALTRYQTEAMIVQSRRALEYLHPDNLTFRATSNWILGTAYGFQGDRVSAGRAFTEALTISQASGNIFNKVLATSGLGLIQELENQLYQAAETYQRALQLFGDHPQPNAGEVHLGLARILYEWNNLDTALQHGQKSLQLARQYESVIDRFILCEVFLARLKLAMGDSAGAASVLVEADQAVHKHNFVYRIPEIAAMQVLILLHQGNIEAAAQLAGKNRSPRQPCQGMPGKGRNFSCAVGAGSIAPAD